MEDPSSPLSESPGYLPPDRADPDWENGEMNTTLPISQLALVRTRKVEVQDPQQPVNHEVAIQRKPLVSANTQSLVSSTSTKEQENTTEIPISSRCWLAKRNLLDNWWVWEIFGLLGSGVTLVAIAILLLYYDHALRPTWKQISLNTVVSWLSTISRLLILIPLSASTGQLKWIWFTDKERELADLNVFDSASRGMLGSINLLWTTEGRHIAGIGAIATILAVAFDPFNQALVHYYQEDIHDPNYAALLANASIFDTYVQGTSNSLDPVLKANIYNSIFNPNAFQAWGIPEYICNSGNCTWGPFASLEARTLCSDITSRLSRSCEWIPFSESGVASAERCNMTIPNGVSASYFTPSYVLGEAMVLMEPETPLVYTYARRGPYTVSPSILLRQYIMATGLNASEGGAMFDKITNDTEWIAAECSLELYVRSINASVQNSVYHESTLATWSDIDLANPDGAAGPVFDFRFVIPENASLGVGKNDTFYASDSALGGIKDTLLNLFSGQVGRCLDQIVYSSNLIDTVSSEMIESLFTQDFANCANPRDKLACLMSNVAAAISKTFRDSALTKAKAKGFNLTASDLQNTANMVVGQTMVSVTLVKVHWEWLSLPVLVWILTTITWISTAIKTRRSNVPKWRNDVIPLLFLSQREHKFDDKRMSNADESHTFDANITELMLKAQNTRVRLVVGRNDAELRYSFS